MAGGGEDRPLVVSQAPGCIIGLTVQLKHFRL
jgi:hypothetical protein